MDGISQSKRQRRKRDGRLDEAERCQNAILKETALHHLFEVWFKNEKPVGEVPGFAEALARGGFNNPLMDSFFAAVKKVQTLGLLGPQILAPLFEEEAWKLFLEYIGH